VRRFPDIFLGALLGVAIFTIGVIFGGLQYSGKATNEPSTKTASESGQSNKKEIAWWQDPIAIFTLGLVLVGGTQLVLFYVSCGSSARAWTMPKSRLTPRRYRPMLPRKELKRPAIMRILP
jgi:hypothetical protein